ncbi:MAG: OB-fold nucleic acid binding domain-containing protein, partial [Candidatus Aenigmatarchaeota archaeon]
RSPAKKVRISDLLNGKYFYGSKEEMKPSYVITPFGEKISRVNLIGTVIDKFVNEDGNYSSVTVDDGTEAIRVKSFEGLPFEKFGLGDSVRAIGKVKEYNGELYISHELIEKVKDVNFEVLLRTEILNSLIKQKKIVDDVKSLSNQLDEVELKSYARDTYSIDEETLSVIIESKKKEIDYKPAVLEVIQKLDEGKGVEIKKLFEVLNLPENVVERTLDELINDGSLYEPQVGFLRKV